MSISASVIVPTHNRPDGVVETLRHLLAEVSQDDGIEVVVVDDGSRSPTSLDLASVRLIRTPGIERSRARNLGAATARGDLLIFLDDDMTVAPGFVASHRQAARDFGNALCVGSVSLPATSVQSPFGRFRRLIEDSTQVKPRGWVDEPNFCTAQNMSIQRRAFLSVGGFDPAIISGEDQDLALRFVASGGRIFFLPEAAAIHRDSAMDIASYCRRHLWGSCAVAPFIRRYPAMSENRARLRFDPNAFGVLSFGERSSVRFRQVMAQPTLVRFLFAITSLCERIGASDHALFALYRVLLGLHLFRGFREGLAKVRVAPPPPIPIDPGP